MQTHTRTYASTHLHTHTSYTGTHTHKKHAHTRLKSIIMQFDQYVSERENTVDIVPKIDRTGQLSEYSAR